eukprot:TRINITY_DN2525_c0_g2_i1.p1 TRINITY_DN2525_c0_g2~~TRINITY_DN2525_c0_g2_i1.p1  ORF type:complete len:512 (+),score=117.42 TRINITY_DN2525_c0_g2_i1:66-1601(+)
MSTVVLILANDWRLTHDVPSVVRTDAQLLFATLEKQPTITVDLHYNADRAVVMQAIEEFALSTAAADFALVICLGTAFQLGGVPYLATQAAARVSANGIELTTLQQKVMNHSRTTSVFLYDLVGVDNVELPLATVHENCLVGYTLSVVPIERSTFVPALIRHFLVGDVDIEVMLRRVRCEMLQDTDGKQSLFTGGCLLREAFLFQSRVDCISVSPPLPSAAFPVASAVGVALPSTATAVSTSQGSTAVVSAITTYPQTPSVYAIISRRDLPGAEDVAVVGDIKDMERFFKAHYEQSFSITGLLVETSSCIVAMRQADDIADEIFRTSSNPNLKEVIDEMWAKGWREIVHLGYGLSNFWVIVFRKTCTDVTFKYARAYDEITRFVDERQKWPQPWRITCLAHVNGGWFVAMGASPAGTPPVHQRISCAGSWADAQQLIRLYHVERYSIIGVGYSATETMWLLAAQQGSGSLDVQVPQDEIHVERSLAAVPACVERMWAQGRRLVCLATGAVE